MEEKYGIKTKKLMTKELENKFQDSRDFVITNYKGLKAQELDGLRKALFKVSSDYFVVKNSIAKRVFNNKDFSELAKYLDGEVGIGFFSDVIQGSKTLIGFSKGHPSLKVTCAYISGKIEPADRIKYLATLPPKEVLLAMVLSSMKSPITGFVGVLNGLLRNLVYAISEIKKKKEGGEAK